MASKFIRRFSTHIKKIEGQASQVVKQAEKSDKKATEKTVKAESEKAKGEGKDKEGKDKAAKKGKVEEVPLKKVNVSLQGANCRAGFAAALLLKQHPLIKKVYMYDTNLNTSVGADLNTIDSSAKVEAFSRDAISYSLRAADIVVLLEADSKNQTLFKKYESSYLRVKRFAETCNLHCPKAIIVICVEPVYGMTHLVQTIFEETPFYNPARLLGSVSSLQGILNTIVARNLNLDPTSVHVPLLGGPDIDTVVPLISLMTPDPGLSPSDQITFYKMIKREATKVIEELIHTKSTLNEGYAIGKICVGIAKGLNNHSDALASVLARSTQAYPLKYLVSTVKFGPKGIYHNYGIPKLTTFELQQAERAILVLEDRVNKMKKRKVNQVFLKCSRSSSK